MALTSDQEQVRCLLEQAIPMLCKNGLLYKSEVCVQVLVGITLDRKQMIHFSFNETVRSGDKSVEQSETLPEALSPVRTVESSASDADDSQSNVHKRKSRISRKRTRRSHNTSYVTETETSDVVREQNLIDKDQSQFSESSSSTGAVQCYPADDRALASTSASALPGSDVESGRTDQNDSIDPSVVVKSEDVIHIKDEPFDVEEITDQDEKNYIGDIASHPAEGYTSSFETYHSDPSAIDYQNPDGTNSMQSVSNVEKYYAESENYMLGTSQAAGDSILQPGTSADEPMEWPHSARHHAWPCDTGSQSIPTEGLSWQPPQKSGVSEDALRHRRYRARIKANEEKYRIYKAKQAERMRLLRRRRKEEQHNLAG